MKHIRMVWMVVLATASCSTDTVGGQGGAGGGGGGGGGGVCNTNDDCSAGEVCGEAGCVELYGTDSDCADGEICTNSLCRDGPQNGVGSADQDFELIAGPPGPTLAPDPLVDHINGATTSQFIISLIPVGPGFKVWK